MAMQHRQGRVPLWRGERRPEPRRRSWRAQVSDRRGTVRPSSLPPQCPYVVRVDRASVRRRGSGDELYGPYNTRRVLQLLPLYAERGAHTREAGPGLAGTPEQGAIIYGEPEERARAGYLIRHRVAGWASGDRICVLSGTEPGRL